jgi:tRNA pseudouridine38-40 synthase
MRTFKLTLAYDGSDYAGWQSQPDRPTVQDALEAALHELTGESLRTVASGRTDSGVHALGQVVCVRSETRLETAVLMRALNALLPASVRVRAVSEASPDFHAIRDAKRKRYRYILEDAQPASVFGAAFAWQLPTRLDDAAMRRAAGALLGEHDFASFETSGSERETTVRTIYALDIQRRPAMLALDDANRDAVWIEVEADGFLYNMVRNIVGTLVEVGRGARPEAWVQQVLDARDRRQAGPTAPPQGLFLLWVGY